MAARRATGRLGASRRLLPRTPRPRPAATTVTLAPAAGAGFLLAYLNRPTSASGTCAAATSLALRRGSASVTGPVRISSCGPALRVSPYVPAAALAT